MCQHKALLIDDEEVPLAVHALGRIVVRRWWRHARRRRSAVLPPPRRPWCRDPAPQTWKWRPDRAVTVSDGCGGWDGCAVGTVLHATSATIAAMTATLVTIRPNIRRLLCPVVGWITKSCLHSLQYSTANRVTIAAPRAARRALYGSRWADHPCPYASCARGMSA